jgi:hypothetical protein
MLVPLCVKIDATASGVAQVGTPEAEIAVMYWPTGHEPPVMFVAGAVVPHNHV